jgi:hypothetical protein
MPKMIALKPIGRRRPGDEFEVNRAQARVLTAIGKAQPAPEPDPVELQREELRTRAAEMGVEVDRRWGSERLQQEIDAADARRVPRYLRRDMVAEDPE